MFNKIKKSFGFLAVFVLVAVVLGVASLGVTPKEVLGFVTTTFKTQTTGYEPLYTFFTATSTNATSTNNNISDGAFRIAGAKRVVLYFTHSGETGISTGTSTFSVQVSPDETNWYNFNRLIANRATSTVDTKLASYSITGATSTEIASMDLKDSSFYSMRCIVYEESNGAIAGNHTCKAQAEF